MKTRAILINITVLFSLMMTACGTGTASAPDAMMSPATETADAMMMHDTQTPDSMMSHASETPDAMMHDTATPDAMMSQATATPDAMMPMETAAPGASAGSNEMADWLGTSLVDARTGQAFKVSDFAGKVVLV